MKYVIILIGAFNKQTNREDNMKHKQLVNKKEVAHWLGHSHEEWIHDLIYRLINKKVSTIDIRVEMKQMYKDYKEEAQANKQKGHKMKKCYYCEGNCPNEPKNSEFLCDGYAGDIDNLYVKKTIQKRNGR